MKTIGNMMLAACLIGIFVAIIFCILQITMSRHYTKFVYWLSVDRKELKFIVKSKIKQLTCKHKTASVCWKKGSDTVFYFASCMKCQKDWPLKGVSKAEWAELHKKRQKKGSHY